MAYIDGDGPNPDIYHLIWKNEGPYNEKSRINIPETIVFIHGIPTAWYFTNQEGKILKKKARNLSYENLIKRFTSKSSQEEIVGYFIHIDSTKLQDRLFMHQRKDPMPEEPTSSKSLIEYYTAQEFIKEFADINACQGKTGILQRFIRPYGAHNEVIQAAWSPNLCVFTRRINSRNINDPKLKPYEKASTFDGPEFYSRSVPLIGKNIPCKLREQCEALVNHITNISYDHIIIQRLVAYFKVDENEKVYFLWAGSVRVKEGERDKPRSSSCTDKPITLEPYVQNIEALRISQRGSSCLPKGSNCVACDSISRNLVPITFKILIGNQQPTQKDDASSYSSLRLPNQAHKEETISLAKLKEGYANGDIPLFIKRLYPKLKLKGYLSLYQQEDFLMQKAQVCDDCFLAATKEYERGLRIDVEPFQRNTRIVKRPLSQERSLSSHRKFRIRQYESSCDNKTPVQQPKITELSDKEQSRSVCKIPSESLSTASKSTIALSIAASLKLRMSMLLSKRKESLNLSEKSEVCSVSLHNNSSPSRLRNQNITDQLHMLVDKLSQNSANVSLAKDRLDRSSRDSSMLTKASLACPRIKPRSLNHLNNISSSRIGKSQNEIRDIDDLLNESDEDSVPCDTKMRDDQSEATTNYQSSLRERYSRNGSRIIENKDLPVQKPIESRRIRANPTQLAHEHYGSANQSMISQTKTKDMFEQDQLAFIKNFFIQPGFPQQPPSERVFSTHRYTVRPQNSLIRTKTPKDIETQRTYASTRRERANEVAVSMTKEKENLQKSGVIETLYKTRVNTAHRIKAKRV